MVNFGYGVHVRQEFYAGINQPDIIGNKTLYGVFEQTNPAYAAISVIVTGYFNMYG